jgi:hypothetical protein
LPEIDVDAFIMERILNLSAYHMKQVVYRNYNVVVRASRTSTMKDNDSDHVSETKLSLIKNRNLSLERLWHYTSYLTHGRNVSCLCWSEQNHVR